MFLYTFLKKASVWKHIWIQLFLVYSQTLVTMSFTNSLYTSFSRRLPVSISKAADPPTNVVYGAHKFCKSYPSTENS